MKVVKNDFTKFSFHYIGKAPSNPLNLIQRELLIECDRWLRAKETCTSWDI